MNDIPVLKSKLTMPELAKSFLLTNRLERLHQNMDSCRAVTVCAPAGYGKTTLAVSYLNHHAAMPCRVCWYRLDPEDKNLSVFLAHLKEVLFPAAAPIYSAARKALEDCGYAQPQQIVSMICREMWALHRKACDTRTYLVLDDFQNVTVQEICDLTRYLLDNLPPSCVIFILNRSSLAVFTEKQKLEKKILEIYMDDLSFSNAEIKDFMLSLGQTAADRKLIEFIEKSTEGWIAGIIILYHAMKNKRTGTASIDSKKLDHEDALFRYMSLEVLKTVDSDTQDALARLALLQDFSETEASEILEINDIKSLMGQCMGFGMFIQRIPGNPVVYRFHSLFREFLLSILEDRCSEEEVAVLHLKAAGYYMSQTTYGRAAEHLAKCGNPVLAMDMVSKEGFNKFMIGETGQLKLWLDRLPEDMIRENPVLLLFKAQLMPNSRQPEIVDTLREVLQLSLTGNDLATYYDAATVLVYIYMCSNNMKGLVEMTDGLRGQRRDIPAKLENTLGILDMVRSIGEDRFSEAEAHSESILFALLPEDSQWLYLILSCIIYYNLGKLDHAERCMETALTLSKFKNIEPSRGFILLFLSIVLSLKNERNPIPSYIDEVVVIGEKYEYEYLTAHGKRLTAFERYLSFEAEASAELLDHAAFHFRQINNKAMAAACRLLRYLWTIQPNSSVTHLEDAREDLALIREACPGLMVHEISLSVLGALARESGDFSLAEHFLLSSVEAAAEKKEHQVLCGAGFHLARLYFAWGNIEQGHYRLKQTMELAAGNRYFMFWDIHIPTLAEMALRGIRYGYCTCYAEELLNKYFDSQTVNYLREKIKIIDESRLAAFVDDFAAAYKAGRPEQLYFVKASLFGTPEISVNGICIPDSEWKTKKVKAFLEYLLFNSGNTVSKESLTELLWPGAGSKSATASQRTALYYLRKILSKYQVEVTGNNAFIQETLEGLLIRKNAALELDVHEFLRLHSEWPQLAKQTSQMESKLAEVLNRMIQIYKGDLMEGSDYGDLIFLERERLKSIFLEACKKLSVILISRGELGQADEILRRAFAAEPYDENLCLKLLELYMAQGRKSKAIKLYYSFKKRLEQELDVKIDKRLTEAVRSPRSKE